jgi:aldehyde dehydrogenase (NAD+)
LALDPVIGAIAAGNAVVLKCSEVAPSVAKVLSEVIPMYLDNQAIKVVEGGVLEGEELLKQKWDKIFFTGTLSLILMPFFVKNIDATFKTLN